MRPHADLFSPCAQGAVVCLASVFVTFALGASAQEADAQSAALPVQTAPSEAVSYEAEFSAEEQAIMKIFAEAGEMTQSGDYESALAKLETAKARIAKFEAEKPGKKADVLKKKYEVFLKDCRHSCAESMLQKCRDEYIKVISEKDLSDAGKRGSEMQKQLLQAKFMYYMGTLGGSQQDLDHAIAADPKSDFAARADALNADFAKVTKYSDVVEETSLSAIDPGYEDRQKDIKKLYHEGEKLYRNRQFTKARDKMEKILILDPYNDQAMQMLTRIYRKLYFVADMRVYNEMLHDQALAEWRWMENIPREESLRNSQDSREHRESTSPLYEKSKRLIIPSVEFIDRSVNDAIDYLREKSKEIDPERSGVQVMIMNQGKDGVRLEDRKVTFSLQNVPLFEAIRYICLQTGLKFRINEKDQVIAIGREAEIARGDTKEEVSIPVRLATVNRMINYSASSAAEGSNSSSSSSEELSVENSMKDENVEETFSSGAAVSAARLRNKVDYNGKLRKYFEDLGFLFPDETFYVAYEPGRSRIVVRHTPETLRKLELLIREIDIDTPLVLIESKIIEISMNDYEELGFDWTLTHENVNPRWSFTVTSPLRPSPNLNNTLINNMNVLPNFGGQNVWSLFLTVNAVDRQDRVEILSSPKLMAKSGESATIKMVRAMFFPTSWSDPSVTSSCGTSVQLEPSVPEFGDANGMGVIFTATPTVSPNNYTINLELNPSVTDLVGWTDYSYQIVFGNFTDPNANNSPITLKMPDTSVRQVQTKVKVYDGQTIVIGGMLVDRQSRQDDKWPILGDVPLFGRLFSSDSTTLEKSNLLISVTSRLVSGDGVPLRSSVNTGLPDFRH